MIALGEDRAGTQAFYESLKTSMAVTDSEMMSTNSTEICEPNAPISPNSDSEYDSAEDNLDTLKTPMREMSLCKMCHSYVAHLWMMYASE